MKNLREQDSCRDCKHCEIVESGCYEGSFPDELYCIQAGAFQYDHSRPSHPNQRWEWEKMHRVTEQSICDLFERPTQETPE